MTILKKCANEIAVSNNELPLSNYIRMDAVEFKTLLRIAINLNKQIMCHHNDYFAEFAVIVGEYIYYFKIDYDLGTLPSKVEDAEFSKID